MTSRTVEAVWVDSDAPDLLPRLATALDGTGPALLPLDVHDPRARDIARVLAAGDPLGPGEDDDADPTALVIATSGSTGAPKGVLLSAEQLAASADATEQRLGGPGHWLLALPPTHIAGMQVLLRAARTGSEPLVFPRETPFTAGSFIALADKLPGPRRYVSLVPTQLRRVLEDPDAAAATAHLFDAVLVGGAATPPALLDAARAAGIRVVTTYGMTETCGGCVYDGVPLDGAAATIDATGAIVLAGPMVARGYRHRPADAHFATPGQFRTADAGEIRPDGTLAVLGRLDDMILTGGVKVAPAAVEHAIAALPGIAEVLIIGIPDDEWGQAVTALIVAPDGASWDTATLRVALADLPATHRPRNVVMVDAIPHLPSGKPDRAAARRLASPAALASRSPGSPSPSGL